MIYPQLHFTGQVCHPPYEANSRLLQMKNLRHMKLDSINIGIEICLFRAGLADLDNLAICSNFAF